ncbi:PREDICTED: uncharacterized protein LOC101236338, partial [Paramuricea clavata]
MDSGSEEESVLDVGEEQLFEEDLEVDEFAETLKLIESNAEEIDQQLLDAISEVEGAKHFQCPDCPKVCKSKGGLTRHRRSKHPDKEEQTMATINIPPINMEIIAKIIAETVEKLREENIYPKEILDIISKFKPSESFLKFITKGEDEIGLKPEEIGPLSYVTG